MRTGKVKGALKAMMIKKIAGTPKGLHASGIGDVSSRCSEDSMLWKGPRVTDP